MKTNRPPHTATSQPGTDRAPRREYNSPYDGDYLNRVAFPLGGIGAGMVCVEGSGKLSHVSVHHRPEVFNEPACFAALRVQTPGTAAPGSPARTEHTVVLEGPVPDWKLFFPWGLQHNGASGNGAGGKDYGLPRFDRARFTARFPFATIDLERDGSPAACTLSAWSPFTPGNADDSSLPVAALEYRFTNTTNDPISAVFSFNARNFMAQRSSVDAMPGGFVLHGAERNAFAAFVAGEDATRCRVNPSWFRGGWFDPLTIAWRDLEAGGPSDAPPISDGRPSPGASLGVPFDLAPGEQRTITLLLCWYVPESDLRTDDGRSAPGTDGGAACGPDCDCDCARYAPWYAHRFASVNDVAAYWRENHTRLRQESARFRDCFYDSTLPPEVIEAVAANLTILKSPTVLRQADGRVWAWEGCHDDAGCCPGSCTHVWNYAQALPHLFPDLERSLRTTEFGDAQTVEGRQSFRVAIPIRPTEPTMLPAADGQLGGIIKVYRDWRISGDSEWLGKLWPAVRGSLDFCIETWDPDHTGALVEPHHNTYDIEFWGADGMCTSIYVAALVAAAQMARAVGGADAEEDARRYGTLADAGRHYLERELWNGEYFVQRTQWEGLRAGDPTAQQQFIHTDYASAEAVELLRREGPKYQYGDGCLSDGIIGGWLAATAGLAEPADAAKIASHLESVYRYNYRASLRDHVNPQRPGFAASHEGGLLLCSWPRGGEPSLPFVYSNEVWTGIEYQVASHLMMHGHVDHGLAIVRTCRDRYDGSARNPFNEYECGHWYARAMASYALLQGMTGIRYDAVDRTLTVRPRIAGAFRSFLATASGYGTVIVDSGVDGAGAVRVEVASGSIEIEQIDYTRYRPR
ncbi:MAG: hypothetical protein EA382_01195 [Spirochaetaceae bacterium]|nr:MAG: hypothetical protein EA382_01195 [Spirochaetaceae bacterium]